MPAPLSSLVSVVITAYNAEEFIAETLRSVYQQTYSPIEVIVIDDGSFDGTRQIVTEQFPSAHYIYQPNGGQPSARNVGIRRATGKYVAFLDSDDLWFAEKISKQVHTMESSGAAWCYCDCVHFENDLQSVRHRHSSRTRPRRGIVIKPLLLGNFISSPTPMIRRDTLFEVGLWDETHAIAEDWNMWLKLAARYPIEYIDEPLAAYRSHGRNMLAGTPIEALLQANLAVLAKGLCYLPEGAPRVAAQARANIYFMVALTCLKRGKSKDARRMLSEALRHDPLQLRLYPYNLAAMLPVRLVQALNWWRQAYCRITRPVAR